MTTTPRSSTRTLIKALAIMAKEDRSEDGIAGAALLEASQRLVEMVAAGNRMAYSFQCDCGPRCDPGCTCLEVSSKWLEVSR